jgi:hypothetical protein
MFGEEPDEQLSENDNFLLSFSQRRNGADHNPANFPDLIWQDESSGGRVYIGNSFTSSSMALLEQHDISCIVNCTRQLKNHFECHGSYSYLRFDRIDSVFKQGVVLGPEVFEEMFDFIDRAVATGCGVLIHCVAGAHRGGTTGLSLSDPLGFHQLDLVLIFGFVRRLCVRYA